MILDGNAMKGRRIIVPASLQDKTLNKLQLYDMGIEKTKLLSCNTKHYLCIVDYHNKFPTVKQVEVSLADNLINT